MENKRKYHFVKFTEDGIWYLKPECIEDVEEHFQKIFGREIKESVRNFLDPLDHPKPFEYAASIMSQLKEEPWVVSATRLENEVYNNRIGYYMKGMECYYPEGVACFYHKLEKGEDYYDEVWKDELEYPTKKVYTMDDVKFMQWNMFGNKGEHWYATIEKRDVYDKQGNLKWNTRKDAEKAAQWFLENKMNK